MKFLIGGLATEPFNSKGKIRTRSAQRSQPRSLATPTASVSAAANAKIFVVHGHDRDVRDQPELVLMRLGLQPFILQNSDGESKTIIEALEQNIYLEAAFGIILLTPDDFGRHVLRNCPQATAFDALIRKHLKCFTTSLEPILT